VKGENYAYEIFGRVNDIEGKHYRCINLGMINSASGLSPETQ
jgi:hypothetical protein